MGFLRHLRGLVVGLAGGVAGLLTTGCTSEVTHLKNEREFDAALAAGKPVLVDFYKGACPTCVAIDGTMEELAGEYEGRAVVAKFELMKAYFAVTSRRLWEETEVRYFPTVILYDDGREVERWVLKYDIDDYRRALDEALADEQAPATRPAEQ
jgi:thioredoxin 1